MNRGVFWGFVILVLGAGGAVGLIQFQKSQREQQLTACRSNLKNLGTALEMYSTDASGRYPRDDGAQAGLALLAPGYLKTIPTCPAAGRDTYSSSYSMTT